jgi:hypothetical protein
MAHVAAAVTCFTDDVNLGYPALRGLSKRTHGAPHCPVMARWFQEILQHSHRDQLSFDVVAWLLRRELTRPANAAALAFIRLTAPGGSFPRTLWGFLSVSCEPGAYW